MTLHDLLPQQCITFWSGVLLTKVGSHRAFLRQINPGMIFDPRWSRFENMPINLMGPFFTPMLTFRSIIQSMTKCIADRAYIHTYTYTYRLYYINNIEVCRPPDFWCDLMTPDVISCPLTPDFWSVTPNFDHNLNPFPHPQTFTFDLCWIYPTPFTFEFALKWTPYSMSTPVSLAHYMIHFYSFWLMFAHFYSFWLISTHVGSFLLILAHFYSF